VLRTAPDHGDLASHRADATPSEVPERAGAGRIRAGSYFFFRADASAARPNVPVVLCVLCAAAPALAMLAVGKEPFTLSGTFHFVAVGGSALARDGRVHRPHGDRRAPAGRKNGARRNRRSRRWRLSSSSTGSPPRA
jgi:hypothetical protein